MAKVFARLFEYVCLDCEEMFEYSGPHLGRCPDCLGWNVVPEGAPYADTASHSEDH